MFEEAMIAPCGLDCSLCSMAHKNRSLVRAVWGLMTASRNSALSDAPSLQCEKRRANQYRFCDQCPDFPCEFSREREKRYQFQYALRESPLTNLREIRELGRERFLEQQRSRWTCGECGGVILVHDGICSGCGKAHTLQ